MGGGCIAGKSSGCSGIRNVPGGEVGLALDRLPGWGWRRSSSIVGKWSGRQYVGCWARAPDVLTPSMGNGELRDRLNGLTRKTHAFAKRDRT